MALQKVKISFLIFSIFFLACTKGNELEGNWEVISSFSIPKSKIVFTNDNYNFKISKKRWYKGQFEIKKKDSLKLIDITFDNVYPDASIYLGKKLKGIYRIEENILTIALNCPDVNTYPSSLIETNDLYFHIKAKRK